MHVKDFNKLQKLSRNILHKNVIFYSDKELRIHQRESSRSNISRNNGLSVVEEQAISTK